jgi:hypothetical protein
VTTFASVLASSSALDWTISGCVAMITASAFAYRLTTRRFGWGPRDT